MRNNLNPLSMAQIEQACPAAFNDAAHASRSDRYRVIKTAAIIAGMHEAGYGVTRAQQKYTHNPDDMAFTRHLVTFRLLKDFKQPKVGETIPECLLINAHNGTTSYNLIAGLFRAICTNGLVVGESFDSIRIAHRGDAIAQVIAGSEKIATYIPKLNEWHDKANVISLDEARQKKYAEEAMTIRYKDERPFESTQLLQVKRPEDKGDTLWKVFNRVQENLMMGGQDGRSPNGRRTSYRPIARVTKDVIFNRRLWDLTEEYMEEAA